MDLCIGRRVVSMMAAAAALLVGSNAYALTVNPAIPITHRVTVQPIVVSNDDGSNTAAFFGTLSDQMDIESVIDVIWAQAGIDVEFLAPTSYDSTFANVGAADPRGAPPESAMHTDATEDRPCGQSILPPTLYRKVEGTQM